MRFLIFYFHTKKLNMEIPKIASCNKWTAPKSVCEVYQRVYVVHIQRKSRKNGTQWNCQYVWKCVWKKTTACYKTIQCLPINWLTLAVSTASSTFLGITCWKIPLFIILPLQGNISIIYGKQFWLEIVNVWNTVNK